MIRLCVIKFVYLFELVEFMYVKCLYNGRYVCIKIGVVGF